MITSKVDWYNVALKGGEANTASGTKTLA
jgi:hypothetical protein